MTLFIAGRQIKPVAQQGHEGPSVAEPEDLGRHSVSPLLTSQKVSSRVWGNKPPAKSINIFYILR